MKPILAFFISLFIVTNAGAAIFPNYWDNLLNQYEALCNACLENRSKKEIKELSDKFNEMVKHPEGKMTSAQRDRFISIQNRYKGIITVNEVQPQPSRVVQVDTVRRVEHVQVIDTVFVKEILGSISLDQRITSNDTVFHIVQIQGFEPLIRPVQDETEKISSQADKVVEHTIEEKQPQQHINNHIRPSFLFQVSLTPIPDFYGGLMVGAFSGFGGYIKAKSNFNTVTSDYDCTSKGITNKGIIMTSGKTELSQLNLTAGPLMEITPWLLSYLGAGYGYYNLYWQDVDRKWAKVSDVSCTGVSLDAGAVFRFGNLSFGAGLNVVDFNLFSLDLSIGIIF